MFNEPLIITKSAKDVLVLLKYFNNVVALQSETSFSFSSYFFSFPLIVIWFDNDYTGIKTVVYLNSEGESITEHSLVWTEKGREFIHKIMIEEGY